MRTSSFATALLVLVSLSGSLPAQSGAVSSQKAKAHYEKADRELNEAWAVAKKTLSESEFNTLKESQRAWVEHRDYLARSPLFTGASAQGELSLESPDYLEAAAGLTEDRTVWLRGLVRDWKEDTLTGVWTDSYGGRVEVVEQSGRLCFVIQCVRGPTSHVGGVAGVAIWNNSIGWFSDKGLDKEKTDETNLSFVLRDRKLEITGANTGYYHGARAYFDGTYVKVEPLNAKQQAKLVKAAESGELPEE